ncbi:MAG: Uma2 family endonuclease, partial [Cyanobacteriota bacterium SKYGB_h_bin112]|nr:Uma2 family endonuclease [Cyanobacteriota bacterium SKYGB_h_bin112]
LGLYLGIHDHKLRYFQPTGELVPTPEEDALQQYQRAEREAQRAERLAAYLRSQGFNPDEL